MDHDWTILLRTKNDRDTDEVNADGPKFLLRCMPLPKVHSRHHRLAVPTLAAKISVSRKTRTAPSINPIHVHQHHSRHMLCPLAIRSLGSTASSVDLKNACGSQGLTNDTSRSPASFCTKRRPPTPFDIKSAVAQPKDRKFLGFSFTDGKEPRRRIAPKAILRFKERIRELTCRTRGISMEQRAKELITYLRGWRGYFGFCQTPSILYRLDQWLRRRLRSALWKQWKHGRKRFAELRQRGVGRDLAAQTAGGPNGPWRIANSPALSFAVPNAYFDSLGIPRLTAPH